MLGSTAFYNDNDPHCVGWLRNLAAAGLVRPGRVDARSILDVRPDDLGGYERVHLFAGIGLWDHALTAAGWTGPVWTGSCPCQPLSVAGLGRGHADERHLWPAFYRLIAECWPATIFGEQVASRDGREWFAAVRADLEALGYACGCADLCAASVGAPHIRQRLYWVAQRLAVADSAAASRDGRRSGDDEAVGLPATLRPHDGAAVSGGDGAADPWSDLEWIWCRDGKWRPTKSGLQPLAARRPGDVAILRAAGNSIVAPLAAAFIRAVMEC